MGPAVLTSEPPGPYLEMGSLQTTLVKMRRRLIQCGWCPYTKGREGEQGHGQAAHRQRGAEAKVGRTLLRLSQEAQAARSWEKRRTSRSFQWGQALPTPCCLAPGPQNGR